MTDVAPLFRPFRIRGLTLKNRIVMAPMTRARSPGAFPNDDNVGYYARRAAGEVGLILSEGTLTRRKGAANDANIPLFWGEQPLAGWKRVIDAVHAAGGKMGPQLWHQGMSRKPGTGHFPDAPSDGPVGHHLAGRESRRRAERSRSARHGAGVCRRGGRCQASRFRLRRAARRARLSDRRILLGAHQSTHRPFRRLNRKACRIRRRSDPPLSARGGRAADHHSYLAVEVCRLRGESRVALRRSSSAGSRSSPMPASMPFTARSAAFSSRNFQTSMGRTDSISQAG